MYSEKSEDLSEFDAGGAGESLELKGLLHALLRRSWIVALVSVAMGFVGAAFVQRLPDLFMSRTVIELQPMATSPINGGVDAPQESKAAEAIETVLQKFRNRSLMERIVARENLTQDPLFLGPEFPVPAPERLAASLLSQSLSATLRPKTSLVDVAAVHPNPAIAQRLSKAAVQEFLALGAEQRLESMKLQNQVLMQKSEELRKKLSESEQKLQEYRKDMDSLSLDANQDLEQKKLDDLNRDLSNTKGERLRLEADLDVLQKADPSKYMLVPSIAQDPAVIASKTKLDEASSSLAALSERYRAKHPKAIEGRSLVENAQHVLDEAIRSAPGRVAAMHRSVSTKEEGLQRATDDQQRLVIAHGDKLIPYRELQREVNSDRTLYESVLQQMKVSSMTVDVQPITFSIVESARPALRMPRYRGWIVLGAVMVGLILGVGSVAAMFFIDSSIKTVDEAERLLGFPVLAAVPSLKKAKGAALLPMLEDADTAVAESFRTLRTALSLLGPALERKVLLFTSAVPAEGKTMTSANIAIAFAQQGLETLLIDADLRRPALSKLFGAEGNVRGLSDYLAGQGTYFFSTKVSNLQLLAAGSPAPNPAELLSNARFGDLIRNLSEHYDRIIIDSAPVNVVSDTLNIVGVASTVALVVRSGSTSRKLVRRAVELLRRAGTVPAGIVLNFLPAWSGVGHYYYYASDDKYGGKETYAKSY